MIKFYFNFGSNVEHIAFRRSSSLTHAYSQPHISTWLWFDFCRSRSARSTGVSVWRQAAVGHVPYHVRQANSGPTHRSCSTGWHEVHTGGDGFAVSRACWPATNTTVECSPTISFKFKMDKKFKYPLFILGRSCIPVHVGCPTANPGHKPLHRRFL